MAKKRLKKEKWTLSFDPYLKNLVIKEARKKGIYPVNFLEEILREKFNPYGYTDVKDSITYVRKLRKSSEEKTDEEVLKEIREWQKSQF